MQQKGGQQNVPWSRWWKTLQQLAAQASGASWRAERADSAEHLNKNVTIKHLCKFLKVSISKQQCSASSVDVAVTFVASRGSYCYTQYCKSVPKIHRQVLMHMEERTRCIRWHTKSLRKVNVSDIKKYSFLYWCTKLWNTVVPLDSNTLWLEHFLIRTHLANKFWPPIRTQLLKSKYK